MQEEHAGVAGTLASSRWEDLKGDLTDKMAAADFWSRPDRYETLARLALMDRVKAAAATADFCAPGSPRERSARESIPASWSAGWPCSCICSRKASGT